MFPADVTAMGAGEQPIPALLCTLWDVEVPGVRETWLEVESPASFAPQVVSAEPERSRLGKSGETRPGKPEGGACETHT